MAIMITMPALSPTMTEGTLAKWLVKKGDQVSPGDVLAEIETDKATMELESVESGVVGQLMVEDGQEGIAVNSRIAVLLEEGEDLSVLELEVPPESESKPEHDDAAPAQTPAEFKPQHIAINHDQNQSDPEAGETKVQSTREALRDAIAEEMRKDSDVFLMGEEVANYQGAYKISVGLLEEFGAQRVWDTPITEMGFTGLGVGAAFAGLKPIVEFMTFNFSMQAIDQIINSAAKTHYMSGGQVSCPIVFRGPNGAASRVAAQHSQCYASWYAHCPGLIVLAPSTPADAKGLLKAAIRSPNPVVFLENEVMYADKGDVPTSDEWVLPIGKARVARPGKDVTIVAFSIAVTHAMKAADDLAKLGIDAEVIDLRSLRPLDLDTIVRSVQKTNRLVCVEEGWPFAGIGSEISASITEKAFDWLDAPVLRVSGADVPMPYAANLEALALPTVGHIVAAVKQVCYHEDKKD